MTYLGILIAAILAVGIAVTLPAIQYTASARLALEVRHRARQITVLLIRTISTVIRTVADRCRRCTVTITALERASATMTGRAAFRFVRLILTVWFAVTLPKPWYTLFVIPTASMLSACTVGNACLLIPGEIELVRTGTLIARCSFLQVTLNI